MCFNRIETPEQPFVLSYVGKGFSTDIKPPLNNRRNLLQEILTMKSKELFANPPTKYHPRKIVHKLCYNPEEELSALLDQGYGGVVTNVPTSDGFTSNPDNLKLFEQALGFIRKAKLPYWIYDEHGYPSGKAAGLTLDGHPELRAKGFFMYKRMCFENTVARYTLPDEADKIVWAAKYKFGGVEERGRVDYESMVAVDFTERSVECELLDHEVLYVFSVKTLHEGTHSMHNVSSQMHNINIMDKRAVDRFIEVGYKPIAEIEGAFEGV